MLRAGESKRRQMARLNAEMLRRHYKNHSAVVVELAKPLRQRHFEWAKEDLLPVLQRYHHAKDARAYRDAANDALRYGPGSWREWLAQPVQALGGPGSNP